MCIRDRRNIILYANAHIVSKGTFAEHDDWAQRLPDGTAATGYTNEIMICMNSPWRDYFLDRVREMLELPIKGLFLDGPSGGTCFCPTCQACLLYTSCLVRNHIRKLCRIKPRVV